MANATVTIGEHLTLRCVVTHLDLLTEVRFSHNDQFLGSLNYTTSTSSVSTDGGSITGQQAGDVYEVNMTVSNVRCNDAGAYKCEAVSSVGKVIQTSAQIGVTRPAEKPTLTMAAYLVENHESTPNPKCTTASLGYNPDYIYRWVVKRNNGTEVEQLPVDRSVNSINYNASTCESGGESELDPEKYVGLNESRLCCRLVDKDNASQVRFEECSQPLKLVSGSYCEVAGNGTSTNLQYPFEPSCYPYVQCIKDFPLFYIRECPVGGAFCFNLMSGQCDRQKVEIGETDTPPGREWECTLTSPYYIPYEDTFPDRCAEYQWCMNGHVTQRKCEVGTEFTQETENDPCAMPSNTTYCGQRRPLLTTAATQGTARFTGPVITTTQNPFVCTADNKPEYIPLPDTFPNKCDMYQRCINGAGISSPCGAGTWFTEVNPPCTFKDSATTYCALRNATQMTSGVIQRRGK